MDAKHALELAEIAKNYWGDIYREAEDDLRFSVGEDHWSSTDKTNRDGRPCLVINQLPQFIHQVTNDMRQNTPSINVLPISGGSDIETAKIFKGLIRNIEYESGGDEIYDTAGEYAVKCSIGFIEVEHDYESDDSFKQKLYLKRVQNPLSVYIDPASVECDGSDAEWGYKLTLIRKDEFERNWPGKRFISFDSEIKEPSKGEAITICEFYKKEYTTIEKMMAEDGSMIDPVEGKEGRKRKLKKTTIKRYKFSGEDLLDEATFPGQYIPLVPVYGEEVWVDGKRRLLSLIRQSKDAQRKYNHWASKESEILAMAPIAPVMAAFGQTEDFADEWTNPGGKNMVLRYHARDVTTGEALPVPQRLAPPPIPTGIINAMQGAKEDIKSTMGLYDASLGKRSNETSGVAIQARKQEGDVATFHFADNRNRSIMQVGRILVCAIPEIYDTSQIIRIIGEEDEPKMVGVNGMLQPEQKRHFDLRKGKYDVRVSTGASFTTKRQEAATLFGEVIKGNPEMLAIIGDLWAKNLDVPGAEAMAARLHKSVNPALLSDDEQKKRMEQPAAPDPEKQQMQQVIQQMQAQMAEMQAALKSKQVDDQVKIGKLELDRERLELEKYMAMQPDAPAPDNSIKDAHDAILEERRVANDERKTDLDEAYLAHDVISSQRDAEISAISTAGQNQPMQ
jgi:hypothetical protein